MRTVFSNGCFVITLPVLLFYLKNLSQFRGIPSQNLRLHVGLVTSIYPSMQFLFSPYSGSLSAGMETGD